MDEKESGGRGRGPVVGGQSRVDLGRKKWGYFERSRRRTEPQRPFTSTVTNLENEMRLFETYSSETTRIN